MSDRLRDLNERIAALLRKGSPIPDAVGPSPLVQDAAYGTLLRQPRRALHTRIADTIERQFADIPEGQPDLLARHYTEGGLIDKAASLWGKAGLRSKYRSALVEAIEQLTRCPVRRRFVAKKSGSRLA